MPPPGPRYDEDPVSKSMNSLPMGASLVVGKRGSTMRATRSKACGISHMKPSESATALFVLDARRRAKSGKFSEMAEQFLRESPEICSIV